MKMKKIMALTIATAIVTSPLAVMAEDQMSVTDAPLEVQTGIAEDQAIQMEYNEFKGKIEKVDDENGFLSIVVKNDNTEGLDAMKAYIDDAILLSDKTMDFVGGDDLEEGMKVTIFYHKDTIMLESYPPILGVDVVIINDSEEYQGVMVSKFDEDLLSAEGDMILRPSEETLIVDKDGNEIKAEDLGNKDLIAFFDIVLTSYPGQTSPKKIVVMPERDNQVVSEFVLESEHIREVDGVQMIPLRLVGESLGYEVSWNQDTRSAELTRGAQWTLVTIGQDNYNFAKMAVKLGTAPVIIDSKTYVPTNFIEEILQANVEVIEDGLKIIY